LIAKSTKSIRFSGVNKRVSIGGPTKLKAAAAQASGTFSAVQGTLKAKKMEAFDTIFTAQSTVSLRRALMANAKLITPYLCYVPWIYGYFTKEMITCACTDADGYFEQTITYPCSGDKPDLYFTSVQPIDGNWVTLYDPGLPCHVYWDYQCGTEVLLVTDEPGAQVNEGEPEVDSPDGIYQWVEPHGIGGFNLSQISTEGRVSYMDGGHQVEDAPFGSTLGFKMGRSNNIPNAKLYYYRLLYRKGTDGDWFESRETVTRHYIHEDGTKITFPVLLLGPVDVNGMHLYRFKPDKPSDLDPSLSDAYDQWPEDNWFSSDTYSGYFQTYNFEGGAAEAHGLYQVKVEVYDEAGNLMDPDAASPDWDFLVPIGPDSTSAPTPTDIAGLIYRPDEGIDFNYRHGKGVIFNIFVDNRSCSAFIDLPVVGGVPVDEDNPDAYTCGFLHYQPDDNIKIAFHGSQPGNNAEVSFSMKCGNQSLGNMNMPREEVASALASGTPFDNNNDGDYQTTCPVSDILGTCTNAAYAEHVYVWAKATNGWSRLSGLDAGTYRAFALAIADED